MDNDATEETYAVYCYYRDGGKVRELIESTAAQRPGVWFFGWTAE